MSPRVIFTVTAASALACGLLGGLTACANPLEAVTNQVAQKAVEGAIENATGTDVSLDGGTIPDTWPADVPKPTGKIIGVFCDAANGCSGSFEVGDAKAGYDDYVAGLTSAGYTQSLDLSTQDSYMGVFDNGTSNVTVSGAKDTTSGTGNVLVIITTKSAQ